MACKICYHFDMRNQQPDHITKKREPIKVYLGALVNPHKEWCPFCALLLDIFNEFVPNARELILNAPQGRWNPTWAAKGRIVLETEPNKPVGMTIVEGEKNHRKLYELQCYTPAGD